MFIKTSFILFITFLFTSIASAQLKDNVEIPSEEDVFNDSHIEGTIDFPEITFKDTAIDISRVIVNDTAVKLPKPEISGQSDV